MAESAKTIQGGSILAVRVATNCPQGGDAGHGGVSGVTLTDEGNFMFGDRSGFGHVGVDPDPNEPGGQRTGMGGGRLHIEALGDFEADALADALEWAGQELHRLVHENAATAEA
jgi:hypothetical protein